MCVWGYTHMSVGDLGSQRLWVTLELGLQKVMSCQTWVLWTELGSSTRAACTLNHRVISTVLAMIFS